MFLLVSPIALRNAKIVYNLGLSECNRVTAGGECHMLNKLHDTCTGFLL